LLKNDRLTAAFVAGGLLLSAVCSFRQFYVFALPDGC
jgi:hypothetical protein